MLLENDEIKLRALEPEDLDFLYSLENDTEMWNTTNTLSPYSKYELKQYIAASPRDIYEKGLLKLVIERKSDGVRLGLLDLFDFDHHNSRIEVGVVIKKEHRGHHYALQALSLANDYALNYLHLHQIYSHVPSDNTASEALFLKAGYKKTSLLPNWIKRSDIYVNVALFQLVK